MKKIVKIATLIAAVFGTQLGYSQKTPANSFDKSRTWYVGLRGSLPNVGGQLKGVDNLISTQFVNPLAKVGYVDTTTSRRVQGLKSGFNLEVGGGVKIKKIGIGVWLGYQEFKRQNKYPYYKGLTDLTGVGQLLDPLTMNNPAYNLKGKESFYVNDITSMYAMLGPEYYIGKFPFYLQVHAYGGVAMHKDLGYGYTGYNVLNDALGNFRGIETLDINSYGDGAIATLKNKLRLYGKVGAHIEYFFSKKLSGTIGADYNLTNIWNRTYVDYYYASTVGVVSPFGSRSVKGLVANDIIGMNYVSANAGLKYWFGQKQLNKSKAVALPPAPTKTPEPAAVASKKTVKVLVKDKCTGTVLPNVNVSVKADGAKLNSGYTNADGVIEFADITPQDLSINGIKNEVLSTTEAVANKAFTSKDNSIMVTLLHDDPRFTLVGTAVEEGSNNPVDNATAIITNTTANNNKTVLTNDKGEFFEQLDQNANFKIVGQAKGKFSAIKEVSTLNIDRCKQLYVRLDMPMEEVAVGKKMVLKSIYYDVNKFNIRPEAAKELDIIVDFMNTNPTVKIELSSHTDSRGSDKANMTLSQKRATEAAAYIASKGIDSKRIVAKGYGESKLVNDCKNGTTCEEAAHQENRRTEFKILSE
jgi:outer membrane protein OmpA-like peptidoglycan-associated protein